MFATKVQRSLEAGEYRSGYFWIPGTAGETPGLLRWSPENGALLELLGPVTGWPNRLGKGSFTIHGYIDEDVSLLGAWVKRVVNGDRPSRFSSSTLALGEHVEPEARWPRAIYSTANLSEWRQDTGLTYSRPNRPRRFRVESRPATRDEVELPGAKVTFEGEADSAVSYAPNWSIETRQIVAVNPVAPLTIAEYRRGYGEPLLSFTTFVSDRPDGLIHEVLRDPDAQKRIVVLRQGPVVRPREWRPDNAYLFHADALADYEGSIQSWWDLYEAVWPALALFGEHVHEGSTYGRSRLLTLHTALEAYSRERHGHKDFRKLRTYPGVPNSVTGCTNNALALLGVSRDYLAHLRHTGQKYTRVDVEENLLESTRRASALMQACLLRELGFDPPEIERILTEHYANWPVP